MLNIILGKCDKENYISDPNMYFDNTYDDAWITSDIGKKIIKNIDKTDVLENGTLMSPVLGGITPRELSGGAKTLMLINFEHEMIFNASACGENCAELLLEITEDKDRIVRLGYPMYIDREIFEICILNDNSIVRNVDELIRAENKYL